MKAPKFVQINNIKQRFAQRLRSQGSKIVQSGKRSLRARSAESHTMKELSEIMLFCTLPRNFEGSRKEGEGSQKERRSHNILYITQCAA
jgi:hypothetical protein